MQVLADGRVRRSEAEWRAILARFEKSGRSISAFCHDEKISRSSFVKWRDRVRETRLPAPAFVEWIAPEPRPVSDSGSGAAFELSFPGGVVLRWKA